MSANYKVFKSAMGVQWLKAGWEIFKTQPMTFMMMHIFIIAVALIPLVLPPLQLLAAFAAPFLTAGFYMAVVSKQQNKEIYLASILAAFSAKGRRLHLFRLGLYQLGVVILISFIAGTLFADTLAVIESASPNLPPEQLLSQILASIAMSDVLLVVIAYTLNMMAFAYALPLVFFKGETRIVTALIQSLKVCFANMAPLGVYGLLIGLLIALAIPLSMVPLLVIMPIAYISFFVSFQAIFTHHEDSDGGKPQSAQNDATPSVHGETGRFDA